MECRNQNCRGTLSVPPNSHIIRCLECHTAYSVANSDDDDNDDDDEVINYKGMKDWCQDFENNKQKAKLNCQNFKKKLPLASNPQTNSPPSPISARAQPPRGRRALICGVTYKKTKHELKGTAQDVKNMHNMLRKDYGFSEESILVLSEEQRSNNIPTKKNIEEGFEWLMRGIQSGDSLLFYFSGHGKRERDFDNDESDGFDETICPLDFETSGMIVDNYINQAIVRPLVKGVVLHGIIDSCHSGTVLDLPYVYDINGKKWEYNYPPNGIYKGTVGGKAICFSACEDYQLAADTSALSLQKEKTGAMTTAFINAITDSMRRKQSITYHEIMDCMHQQIKDAGQSGGFFAGIRRIFHRRILQDPQLSSSERFNVETAFKL